MLEKIKETVKKYEGKVLDLRRHFHMHPELSLEEFQTTDYIIGQLDAMGIPWIRPTETGVIGTITGKGPGRCVGLRADIDALNVTEATGVDFASRSVGNVADVSTQPDGASGSRIR